MELLDAALAYAKQGFAVFPLAPRSKQPLISAANGGHGLHDATTDLDQIRRWWTAHPNANIGLRTGISFDVIDLDGEDAVYALDQARAGGPGTDHRSGRKDGQRLPLLRAPHGHR